MRLAYYAGASTAAAIACLLYAFEQRPNFYSAAVYLASSNACILLLTNLALTIACSFMYALQRLLYGPLRPIEVEQLSEKAWYAVLDILLLIPTFREDYGGWLLVMFTLLMASKVWGWIAEGRVDILEQQPPANPKMFHLRLSSSLLLSCLFTASMLRFCVNTVASDPRPGMMVVFTFEFAISTVISCFTLGRYALTVANARVEKEQIRQAIEERKAEIRAERAAARQNETAAGQPAPASPPSEEPIEVDENEVDVPGWEEKRRYLFGLEVVTDFLKLIIYIVFFTVSVAFNGLPMHIMRDVYMTFASFSKRVADYIAYRKATSDMNTRYPDATTEEIRGDACIVCRETMVAWDQPEAPAAAPPADGRPAPAPAPPRRRDEGLRAKKLPCGHILHLRCLKAWLERQQVCPTCRRPVVAVSAPGAPGQGGVGGAQGGAPGQPGAQRPQGQGRARILNLGPIRIGFLNGPGDQINNIIRQMNGQAPVPPAHPPQQAIQQGPNHLGLQMPYADGQQPAANGHVSGPRASVPTQVQLHQIEQRILQDAHNLGVEQQQLITLRMMEAELARLRAHHSSAQGLPQPPMMPQQPQPPQMLLGNPGQQFGNGHEHLPQGMTLPEGWTVMPLQRTEAMAHASQPIVQSATVTIPSGGGMAPAPLSAQDVHDAAVAAGLTSASGVASAPQAHLSSTGPTDERGSPLFIPTAPAPAPAAPQAQQQASASAPSSETPAPSAASAQATSNALASPAPAARQPWDNNNGGGWSFGDEQERLAESASQLQNGSTAEQAYEGKGKGKAAEVEDASDRES